MNRYLMRFLLVALLFTTAVAAWHNEAKVADSNVSCIEEAVGKSEVIGRKAIDLDMKGTLDEVVLYKNDHVHVLVVADASSQCEVLLNRQLTAVSLQAGYQSVEVRKIELIELTGDTVPELYVWINKMGGGRFVSAAVHAIYTSLKGDWQEALHVEQCLAFSSLEFQSTLVDNLKDIYRDTDVACDPPISTGRTYEVLRWNGSRFASIENGTVVYWSLYPLSWYPLCIAALLVPAALMVQIVMNFAKRHQSR